MSSQSTTILLFDIDGTLLLSGGAGLTALNRTFEELFTASDAFDGIPVAGRTDPLLLRDALSRTGIEASDDQRIQFFDRYCDLLSAEMTQHRPGKRLMPGVPDLLRALSAHGDYAVGLLTGNVGRAARIKLEHFDLWQFFGFGAYGDDAPHRNDLVPVAVARAKAAGIGVESTARVVVIGDTPCDVECARAGGAASIGVATGTYDIEALEQCGADAVVSDLCSIDDMFEMLATVRPRAVVTECLGLSEGVG